MPGKILMIFCIIYLLIYSKKLEYSEMSIRKSTNLKSLLKWPKIFLFLKQSLHNFSKSTNKLIYKSANNDLNFIELTVPYFKKKKKLKPLAVEIRR